jgi:hypothetical protein
MPPLFGSSVDDEKFRPQGSLANENGKVTTGKLLPQTKDGGHVDDARGEIGRRLASFGTFLAKLKESFTTGRTLPRKSNDLVAVLVENIGPKEYR